MSKREVVAIALRFLAIFIALFFLNEWVRFIWEYFARHITTGWTFMAILIHLVFIGIVILIWQFAPKIAGIILPSPQSAEEPSWISQGWAESVAFTVLGLYILSTAIPSIFSWLILRISIKNASFLDYGSSAENIASIVSTLVKLVIGLWLILGAKGLRGLIALPRILGQQKKL